MKKGKLSLTLLILSIALAYTNYNFNYGLPFYLALICIAVNLYGFARDVSFFARPTFLQFGHVDGVFRILPTIAISFTNCSCFGVHLEWGNLHTGIVSLCPVKAEDQKTSPDAAPNE